jgi:aspartyl-tRNA(Asn)/glutamyl-tRNA(Gln) amidotransferase subunit C
MSRISRGEVERIAELARLSLSDDEAVRMTADLDAMLDYVESLAALDTHGVEPTAHVLPLAAPLRPDRAEPGLPPDAAVANAPRAIRTTFAVPKVIEGGEG